MKNLGRETGSKKSQRSQSKIATVHKNPFPPTTQIELMKFIGPMNFYFKNIVKLHVNMKPLCSLLHDTIKFRRIRELETLFK